MRRATWILWLMLALLPLRGWAVASMGVPVVNETAATAVAAVAADDAAMPPCHQAADVADAGATSCQSCDWCHATLAGPARGGVAPMALPAAPPRLVAARDTGRRLAGGLDRPPRSALA
ncbi:MAG TPA: hypothetical protein VLI72_14850 [Methylibium sp.]|nr:hypothetical protein [Methylibium sp.]